MIGDSVGADARSMRSADAEGDKNKIACPADNQHWNRAMKGRGWFPYFRAERVEYS
jgi:hypothetical protein